MNDHSEAATWTAWFGDFATEGAAKRFLTMNFVGPKVPSRDEYLDSEVRAHNGTFQVRLLERPFVSLLDQLNS